MTNNFSTVNVRSVCVLISIIACGCGGQLATCEQKRAE